MVGTDIFRTGNDSHRRDILKISGEAVEKAKENHLNF